VFREFVEEQDAAGRLRDALDALNPDLNRIFSRWNLLPFDLQFVENCGPQRPLAVSGYFIDYQLHTPMMHTRF
jgi:hypothetical protein